MTDELSFLVQETFRVNELRQAGIIEEFEDGEECWNPAPQAEPTPPVVPPKSAGLFFHLSQQSGTFIIRTLASTDLAHDYQLIVQSPEDYPSLRLLGEGGGLKQLAWWPCASREEAQMVHARVGHRRFPMREEEVCNLSDPGFCWWLEHQPGSFTLYAKRSVLSATPERVGPLADPQLAPHRWHELMALLSLLPLELGSGMEGPRYYMKATADGWVVDEFARVFREGCLSDELHDLFRLLKKRGAPTATLETCWYFLSEIAAIRRFWREIETTLAD